MAMFIRHEWTGMTWKEGDKDFLFAWAASKDYPDRFTIVCDYPDEFDSVEEYVHRTYGGKTNDRVR